jgi:predicted anti-sigma-YlaC factor YlaD
VIRRWLQRRRFMREHRWTHARLSEYLDQDMGVADRTRVEAHVGICSQCRRVLATLRRTIQELRDLRSAPDLDLADAVIERLRREG